MLEESRTVIDVKTYKTVQQAVILIRLDESRYISQLQFTYPVDESRYASYGVEAKFYRDGELLNDYLMYDTINSRLYTGYMNVDIEADEIELETYGDFGFDGTGVTVGNENRVQFNWYLVIFLIGSGLLLLFLLLAKELYMRRLEVVLSLIHI